MRRTAILSILTMMSWMLTNPASGANATYNYTFKESSVLSRGKWVKVETTRSGIYEIPYSELREMGFSNPSRVSVFGAGGTARSSKMMNGSQPTQSDDPEQIPVFHANDKLMFYGEGVETVRMDRDGFVRQSLNIYTTHGHYFLTESASPMTVETTGDIYPDATDRSVGYGFAYNEHDRNQGLTDLALGQDFWDFDLKAKPDTTIQMNVSLRADGCQGSVAVGIIPELLKAANGENSLTVSVGGKDYSLPLTGSTSVRPLLLTASNVVFGDNAPKIRIRSKFNDSSVLGLALMDYIVLNYSKDISKATTSTAYEDFGLTGNESGTSSMIRIPEGAQAWDITDPRNPVALPTANGAAYFTENGRSRQFAVFNPSCEQLRTTGATAVSNQDLHSLQNEPIELLIVTVPQYRDQAQAIAALHEEYDGIRTLVVTPQECYDEFTSGNPDPQAIRMLAKMIYQANRGNEKYLKNILLFGELDPDPRNIRGEAGERSCIIGIQEAPYVTNRDPNLLLDYYGMASDNVDPGNSLYNEEQNMGVGTLHPTDKNQADLAVSKIRHYLESLGSSKMAWLVNESLAMSCKGDAHEHDNGVKRYENELQGKAANLDSKLRHCSIIEEFYTEVQAKDNFLTQLDQGKLLTLYMGHSTSGALNQMVFTPDLEKSGNSIPGFMMIGGCDATLPDLKRPGIGSKPVQETMKGFMGILSSTRTAWSAQNLQLSRNWVQAFFEEPVTRKNRSVSPTIGEVYALAKTKTTGSFNETVYIYTGDPALVVPIALRSISLQMPARTQYQPGEVVTIKGRVLKDDVSDSEYNGTAVLKICVPDMTLSQSTDPEFRHTFSDGLLGAYETEVTKGRFEIKITIPEEANEYRMFGDRQSLNIFASSYDPEMRMGGTGYGTLPLGTLQESAEEGAEYDTTAPTATVTYSNVTMTLDVEASDDCGLMPGIGDGGAITLTIDGEKVNNGEGSDPSNVATTYYRFPLGVGALSKGSHTAKWTVTDISGNTASEQTLTFTVEDTPALALEPARSYGTESIYFNIHGEVNEGLKLIIEDSRGNTVHESTFRGTMAYWDCSRARKGHYRAGLRYENGMRGSSDFVDVYVIE